MKFGFDKETLQIMELAHARAKEDRVRFITLDHILAVLLRVDDKSFQQRLSRFGINVAEVIENFEVPCQYFRFHTPSGIEFSNASESVLRFAEKKAIAESRNVRLVDLLYAILTEANKAGVMFERLALSNDTNPESLYS